ncbi:late competence development protein ComFB [Andreesenia angusta]|uniref:Late competence development protein ComFB n=1 Tax=Andreesenia angusta TaxID=39480 RepID=A0A1S1V574_9FIRM|nr:late competence development ComFB family protein [Andreesenia angusta]OHW61836.1 late competence development protein ComFB [Andreesenia angusta]
MVELKNYMETLVDELMVNVLRDYDCPYKEEERFKMDIKAIALNNLPTMYYVSHRGEAYNKVKMLEPQFKLSIIQEIVKAVEIVRKNPRGH